MGLLDDAIREHLELKRRRGADPVEIERAEQEALGPVRRAPEGTEEEELGPEAAADQVEEYEYDDEYEYEYEEEEPEPPYAENASGEPAPHYAPPEPPHHTFDEHLPPSEPDEEPATRVEPAPPADGAPSPHAEPDPATEQPPSPHPAEPEPAAAQTPPPHPAEPGGSELSQETAEYEVEHEHEHEHEGEDMLEETPEFLQDTPEHDRLWFEQRPPRDFDFED